MEKFISDKILISKTDTQGNITYCSPSFLQLCGYDEQELMGRSHNLLRHPDMPKGIYYLMWENLKANREFNAFILNKTKSGQSYWAFTNITPVHTVEGKLVGYTCAKRPANEAGIGLFSVYYEQMRDEERRLGDNEGPRKSAQLLQEILAATGDSYEASVFKLQLS